MREARRSAMGLVAAGGLLLGPVLAAQGAKAPAKEQKIPVRVTVTATWSDRRECSASASPPCHSCREDGRLDAAFEVETRSDNGMIWRNDQPGRSKVTYSSREYCPVDGEGKRTQGQGGAAIVPWGVSSKGGANFLRDAGLLMMMDRPAGATNYGRHLLVAHHEANRGELQADARRIMAQRGSPGAGLDRELSFTAPFTKSGAGAQGDPHGQVAVHILANVTKDKRSGSVSWKEQGYGSLFQLIAVDIQGLQGGRNQNWVNGPEAEPSKVANYTVTWNFTPPGPEVKILKVEQKGGPRAQDPAHLVYKGGALTLVAEAEVVPAERAGEVKWEPPSLGEVQGRVLSSLVVAPGRVKAEISYPRLPARNDGFGEKQLKASLAGESDQKAFSAFFERDGKDHPPGGAKDAGTPNWFFYWKQGPVPELDRFEYSNDPALGGGYSMQNRRLIVTQGSPEAIPGQDVNLTGGGNRRYHLVRDRVEGIQAVAAVVRHEQRHKELMEQVQWPQGRDPFWRRTGEPDPGIRPLNDYDMDGVPDEIETGASAPSLDPFQPCTYSNFNIKLFFPDPAQPAPQSQQDQLRVSADNELLAIVAERKRVCREEQDWAFPGTKAKARGN